MSEEHRDRLITTYTEHLKNFRASLAQLTDNFPQMQESFETRVGAKVALIAALREIEEDRHSGLLTSKSFLYLESRLHHAINAIPELSDVETDYDPGELVTQVPLFAGLEQQALDEIAARASMVNYLGGDTVIATGQHGDALYVIVRGELEVMIGEGDERSSVAELGANDFFGEMALLGDSIRTADVVAESSCTLLRIKCNDVLDVAERYPGITDRLEQAKAERSKQ